MSATSQPPTFMRRALLAILLFGLVGTEVELFLLKHTEGFWQVVPVVVMGLATVVALWCALAPSAAALHALRLHMVLFVIAGTIGVVQHFTGNIGYERESNPGLAGTELYAAAAMGSTPLLAPGVMLQLGLIGLLYTFRHPILTKQSRTTP